MSAEPGGPEPPEVDRRKHRVRWTLGIVFGLGVSAVCVYIATRKVSPRQVGSSLAEARYIWLVPTVLLTYAALWLRGVRWRALFLHREKVSPSASFHGVSIGLMFNNILPTRAGEVIRVLAIRRATGVSAIEAGTTVVIERLLDVFVIAILGLALWPALPERTWINVVVIVCAAIVVAFVALVVALTVFRRQLPQLFLRVVGRLPFVSDERAQSLRETIGLGTGIMVRPIRLAEACALSVLIWGGVGVAGWCLFPAFSLKAGSVAPWLVLVASSFALSIPSSPGTVGVYEASVQAALTAYGVSKGAALSYAVILHAVNFFPIIATGLISTAMLGVNLLHPRAGPRRGA